MEYQKFPEFSDAHEFDQRFREWCVMNRLIERFNEGLLKGEDNTEHLRWFAKRMPAHLSVKTLTDLLSETGMSEELYIGVDYEELLIAAFFALIDWDAEIDPREYTEFAFQDSFLKPEFYYGYMVEDNLGQLIPFEVFTLEAKEQTIAVNHGWYYRLSAPGYLDCTDYSGPFDSHKEAAFEMLENEEFSIPEPSE